jgi:cytochrome c oxidase assembly protein subunit 15
MNLQVAFEWSHRVFAGGIAVSYAAVAAFVLRNPTPARRERFWLGLGALLLGVQIVLGGLTVLLKLAPWTVTAHLITGNSFNATVLALALSLSEGGKRGRTERREGAQTEIPRETRRLVFAFAALLAFQLALGGAVSSQYAGLACPEWPTCNGGSWFPSFSGGVGLHLAHRTGGYLLLALGALLFGSARAWLPGRGVFAAPIVRVALQVGVGIANVTLGLPVEVTALHSALAALLVLATTWLCYTHARHASI